MQHHLTATIEVRLDLTVETGAGPEEIGKALYRLVKEQLPESVGDLEVSHRGEPVVSVGAWHLSNPDNTFSGGMG